MLLLNKKPLGTDPLGANMKNHFVSEKADDGGRDRLVLASIFCLRTGYGGNNVCSTRVQSRSDGGGLLSVARQRSRVRFV